MHVAWRAFSALTATLALFVSRLVNLDRDRDWKATVEWSRESLLKMLQLNEANSDGESFSAQARGARAKGMRARGEGQGLVPGRAVRNVGN